MPATDCVFDRPKGITICDHFKNLKYAKALPNGVGGKNSAEGENGIRFLKKNK
jgi:hypothetical protein